jgi:ubiquitin-like domain-containing CTD phosphatase 1
MWLESKLIELGMVGDDSKKYKISFVLDRHPMFSVYSVRHGKPFKHEVKALELIWKKVCSSSSRRAGRRRH